LPGGLSVTAHARYGLSDREAVEAMPPKADQVLHGEVMRAAVDTAATVCSGAIRRPRWHGHRVVMRSRWSGQGSWPTLVVRFTGSLGSSAVNYSARASRH
jgi:hypothetical protein